MSFVIIQEELHSWANAQDILEVLNDRFSHASKIIVAQLSVADWSSQIPNPALADAIFDRLVHNAFRLQLTGERQRKLR